MSAAPISLPVHMGASRSRWLESMRGAACLAVVLYHADLHSPASVHPVEQLVARVTVHGWTGVSVFFALSGYLITDALERRSASGHGALVFWLNRALRIYPTFWAAFLASSMLALVATCFNGLPALSAWPATFSAWLGDLTLTGLWFDINPRLIVSWSLNYEIGFYVIAGLALAMPISTPLFRMVFFVVITTTAHLAPNGFLPFLDLWPQFAAGIFAAYALSTRVSRLARGVAAAYVATLLAVSLLTDDSATATAAFSALSIMAFIAVEARLPAPPAWLVALGGASYSIYLVHVPVMSPLRNLIVRHISLASHTYLLACLGIILAGITAGLIFHRIVELPLERFRRSVTLS